MAYTKIHISTFEEFFPTEERRRDWIVKNRPAIEVEAHDKRMTDREEKRNAIKQDFPYTVILEGAYPEHDFVSRWCWQNIGPVQCDECHESSSEYPGCPLVLATEYILTSWHYDNEKNRVYWFEKAYIEENVPKHGHEGTWKSLWLGKTGYDYGSSEYYFQNQTDRDRFLAAVPIFTLGERYEGKAMTTMTAEKAVHQSKWGYHPISLEASKKLRYINGVYAKAQHLAGAWERWDRKQPQNRIQKQTVKDLNGRKRRETVLVNGAPVPLPEPQICKLFHEKVQKYVRYGCYFPGRAKDNGFGDKIIHASRQARTPQPTPEAVAEFLLTEEEINVLYEHAKGWMENR